MEKKGFTPLQSALIAFIVSFVLGPFVLIALATITSFLPVADYDVQIYFFFALACGVVTWVVKKLKEHRAYLAALHEQVDLLTDQANLLAEHINALEGAGAANAETSSTPEKD